MYLAIDVGGTKTLVSSFTNTGTRSTKEVRFLTPKSYLTFLTDLKKAIKELGEESFDAVGIGVPGRLNRKTGVIISCGNLTWKNAPAKRDIMEITNCPVFIENDAKVGGLSEALLVKNDFKNVLYIALGTGIGVSFIMDGIIDTDYGDRGGLDVIIDHNGQLTDWESIVSGRAIKQRFGKKATDITDQHMWATIAHDLALGLAIIITGRHPDAIVMGGGAGKPFDRYGELLKNELAQMLNQKLPEVLPAKRADEAVIYGCYDLIKQNI